MTFRQAQRQMVVTDAEKGFDPLGRFYDFVINPSTGKCEALWIQSLFGLRILFPDDITAWQDDLIHIASIELLHKPENLPRLEKIFTKEASVMYAPVWQGGQMIGSVRDFWFDSISPRIVKILVKNGWWLFGKKRIIESHCIELINEKGVFISNHILNLSSKNNLEEKDIKTIVQEPGMEKVEIHK